MAAQDAMSGQSRTHLNETNSVPFDYDEFLDTVGQFGPFQRRIYILLLLPVICAGATVFSYSFIGYIPDHRCHVPVCDNGTSLYEPEWLRNVVPYENDIPQKCEYYSFNLTDVEQCWNGSTIENITASCDEWVYDYSLFTSTIVTEFDLTCGREWEATLTGSIYMFGMLVGALTFGTLADMIGRKLTFLIANAWMVCFAFGGAFAPNYETYAAFRFLAGAGGVAVFEMSFVLGVELVGPAFRTYAGLGFQIAFSIGGIIVGLVTYFIRNWRPLQIVISAPFIIFLSYWWLIPESVRWLVAEGKAEDTQIVIENLARVNGKKVPPNFLEYFTEKAATKLEKPSHKEDNAEDAVSSLKDVLRSPILLKRVLILFISWITSAMVYFGLSQAATNLAGGFFINFELSMLVEVPSYLFGMWSMNELGRNITLSGTLIVGGLSSLLAALFQVYDIGGGAIASSLVGKFCVSLAFAEVFNYAAELFPTSARAATVGFCSTFCRIGTALSPFIANLGERHVELPYIIFGSLSLLGGLVSILLPETLGQKLPDTLEEAEALEK